MSVSEPGDNLILGSAVTSTLIAAGSGGVTVLVTWKFMPGGDGVWSLAKTINGMLAGMIIDTAIIIAFMSVLHNSNILGDRIKAINTISLQIFSH